MRTGSPYREATLAHDFADVREWVFPGDARKLMDMRPSGVVEAVAGSTDAVGLSAKLANRTRSAGQTRFIKRAS